MFGKSFSKSSCCLSKTNSGRTLSTLSRLSCKAFLYAEKAYCKNPVKGIHNAIDEIVRVGGHRHVKVFNHPLRSALLRTDFISESGRRRSGRLRGCLKEILSSNWGCASKRLLRFFICGGSSKWLRRGRQQRRVCSVDCWQKIYQSSTLKPETDLRVERRAVDGPATE